MRTTIEVKKIYTKEGLTKKGKPYNLTKLLAGGKYYTTFKPVPAEIKEGSMVELEFELTDTNSQYDITRIVSVADIGTPTAQSNANPISPNGAASQAQSNSQAAPSAAIEAAVAHRLAAAKKILAKEMPGFEEYSDYMQVLAEILHQLGAEEMSLKIQANKERNLQAIR